ncbi:MAG TPA: acyl-CoA thioesterase/bile acid-CoA:amino acid N-acyltransferase family protein [Polyangiaceae bacterium]|nr:acyl-CoA thioesterase/bile acid-CoA:amino acid N-acyltransferase family protein [Polyangiaceae bacterium]
MRTTFFALFLVACGSTTADVPDAGNAEAGTPAIAFFDVSTGAPVETTTMLWANALDIRVTGLPALTQADVTARFTGWGATATFTSDAEGSIDLATAYAASGSYQGVDADGIVWSMTKSTSPDDPQNDPFGLRVHVDVGGITVASAELARLAVTDDVTCADVSDDGLVGYYCAKNGAAPRGAIVVFGGSEGGISTGQSMARYYASLGYPSLGLAYFGQAGVPATLADVPLEYFGTAFAWVAKQPAVAPGKLVVMGGSRGGELALILGANFPELVTAVVAQLPSGLVWPGDNGTLATVGAWTLAGKELPYVAAWGNGTTVHEPDGINAFSETPAFHASIAASSQADLDAATTHVENTNGPILMIAGAADDLWPSCDLATYAMDRLSTSGHATKYGDTLVCYPDAGHNIDAFTVGTPTTTAMHTSTPVDGAFLALGGTPEGIAHATRDADNKLRLFLAKNL